MHRRKLDYRARRRFDQEWGVRGARRSLWDADHIIPVAEGGGECDLDNMRTLCLKCHRIATAALRKRLAELKQAGTDSIESPTSGGGSSP
jgi:5-methylcytosine-specific restriction endonuclease McrA